MRTLQNQLNDVNFHLAVSGLISVLNHKQVNALLNVGIDERKSSAEDTTEKTRQSTCQVCFSFLK